MSKLIKKKNQEKQMINLRMRLVKMKNYQLNLK